MATTLLLSSDPQPFQRACAVLDTQRLVCSHLDYMITRSATRKIRAFALCFAMAGSVATVACEGPNLVVLTPDHIRMFGTIEFGAPIDKTFSSCVNALKIEGYEVAVAQEEKGLIITKPKVVYQGAAGGQGYATLITMEKRYTFRLEAVGPDKTRVVASPEAIENGRDVTGEPIWTIHFQQADWAKLFRRVQSLL